MKHYQTSGPRRFACVSYSQVYRDLAKDPAVTSAWYMRPKAGIDAGSRQAFGLVQFSVEGDSRPIRRAVCRDQQLYSVDLGQEVVRAGKPVSVSYTYRTLASQNRHLLRVDVEQTIKGFSVELDYSDTDSVASTCWTSSPAARARGSARRRRRCRGSRSAWPSMAGLCRGRGGRGARRRGARQVQGSTGRKMTRHLVILADPLDHIEARST